MIYLTKELWQISSAQYYKGHPHSFKENVGQGEFITARGISLSWMLPMPVGGPHSVIYVTEDFDRVFCSKTTKDTPHSEFATARAIA